MAESEGQVTDTPRTDAALAQIGTMDAAYYSQPMTALARQLERELAEHKRNHSACEFAGAAIAQQRLRIEELERDLAAAQRQNHDHEMYVAGIARELAAAIASGLSGDGGG
jgi:hypothetical protein